jgi:hypothetical protein
MADITQKSDRRSFKSHVDVQNGMCIVGCPFPEDHVEGDKSDCDCNRRHRLQPHTHIVLLPTMPPIPIPTPSVELRIPRLRNLVETLPAAYKRTLAQLHRLQLFIIIVPEQPKGTSAILPNSYTGPSSMSARLEVVA